MAEDTCLKETIDLIPIEAMEQDYDYFTLLSLEIICKILKCLPLLDVLKMSYLCKKSLAAVTLYLKTLKSINFTEGKLEGFMPSSITDDDLYVLIKRCNELRFIYGFHPIFISERRQRGKNKQKISIPGVLSALNLAPKLKGIEISNVFLLGAILNYFPELKIIGTFKNRVKPIPLDNSRLYLTANPKVTSLHLTGVIIPELPKMESVVYLYLRMVKITHPDPFRDFLVPNLNTFVMSHCSGPQNTLSYVQLLAALAAAKSISRLELVKVPFLGGLLQHIVEDSWRAQGFRMLTTVIFGGCKNALELDLGYLLITAAKRLKELSIQPSLTKDSLFSALKMADVTFSKFRSLHLGYIDPLTETGESVILEDLNEAPENPAMITDNGMKAIGQIFMGINLLEMYNCPHILQPSTWFTTGAQTFAYLEHLTLRRCHAVRLSDFRNALSNLPRLETLHLEYMFKEPPKGCARVGLSAGTGLGVASALVQNHGNGMDQNPAGEDGEENEDQSDDLNNNNENEVNRATNGNVEAIPNPHPSMPINNSRDVASNNPANQRQENDPEIDDFDEFDVELLPDMDDVCSRKKKRASGSHVMEEETSQGNEAYEFSQPGCSHWNEAECSSPKSKVRKTVKVSNVKGLSKRYPTEYKGNIREPTKSVKIISVKCRSPSPPKPQPPTNNGNNKLDSNVVDRQLSVHNCANVPQSKSCNTSASKNSAATPSTHVDHIPTTGSYIANPTSVSNTAINCESSTTVAPNSNGSQLSVSTYAKTSSENNTSLPNNAHCSYMFHKPPPKYSASQGDMQESSSSNLHDGNNYANVTSRPGYVEQTNFPGPRSDPPKYETPSSNSENPIAMDISPPDYNTAMAHGNVMNIPPCSCIIPNSTSDHQGIPEDDKVSKKEENNVVGCHGVHNIASASNVRSSSTTDNDYQNIMPVNSTGNPSTSDETNLNDHTMNDGHKQERTEDILSTRKGKSLLGKKKGLLKRKYNSSSSTTSNSTKAEKSCQAISEDIREATVKAQQEFEAEKKKSRLQSGKNSSTRRSSRLRTLSTGKPFDDVTNSDIGKKMKWTSRQSKTKARYKENMHHKSTSTSDPVKEDDHIQVLPLRSNSLVSVYLHMVGITDLIVDKCPNLTYITGGACRVLKKVTIYSAPKLTKTSFYQCPKLDQTHLVNEVCDQISERNRTIFLRPMQQFDPRDFESMLFHQPDIGYHLCIIYDYSPCPNQTLYNRIRVANWMDLFCGMNSDLLRTMDFIETSWYRVDADRYPWKRDIYRMQGGNDNGSRWEIMTDIPWLRMLSQCSDIEDDRQLMDDKKDGVYCPAAKGHHTVEDCMDDLTFDLAEYKASNQIFFCNCIVVFFNMCDTSGRVAPDIYS